MLDDTEDHWFQQNYKLKKLASFINLNIFKKQRTIKERDKDKTINFTFEYNYVSISTCTDLICALLIAITTKRNSQNQPQISLNSANDQRINMG